MANPLYEELNGNLQNGSTISMLDQFSSFAKQFYANGGVSPRSVVEQLLNSGRMTKDQFEQYSQMANMITGRNRF